MTPGTRLHTNEAKEMDMHPSHDDFQRKAAEAEAKIRLMRMETEAETEKWQHIMNEAIGYPDGMPVADLDKSDDYINKSIAYIYERRIYADANREPQTRAAATRNVLQSNSNSQSRNQRDSIRQDPDGRLGSRSKLSRPLGEKENSSKQVMPSVNDAKHTIAVSAQSTKPYELEKPNATPKSSRVPRELKALHNHWFHGNPSNSTTIDSDDDDDDDEITAPYSRRFEKFQRHFGQCRPSKGQHPLPPLHPQDAHTQGNRREGTADNEMEVNMDDSWQIQVDEKGYRPTKRRRRDGGDDKN